MPPSAGRRPTAGPTADVSTLRWSRIPQPWDSRMSFKPRRRVLIYGTLIGAVLLPVHSGLAADEETAKLQRQTERLQRQIDALQQELKVLQRQVAETNRAPRSPPADYGGAYETRNRAGPQPSRADYAGASPGYTKAPLGNTPWP